MTIAAEQSKNWEQKQAIGIIVISSCIRKKL
jgi:hypothetical protein